MLLGFVALTKVCHIYEHRCVCVSMCLCVCVSECLFMERGTDIDWGMSLILPVVTVCMFEQAGVK